MSESNNAGKEGALPDSRDSDFPKPRAWDPFFNGRPTFDEALFPELNQPSSQNGPPSS